MKVAMRASSLSKELKDKFFGLVRLAADLNQDALWVTSLSELNDEDLARAINECHAMGEEGFKQYLTKGGLKTSTVLRQILR